MRAAIYERFQGPIEIHNLPDPKVNSKGAIIEVKATGLCRSDWHGWMGHDPDIRLPHVPGHELAGVVAAVGKEVRNVFPGDRVTVPFVCACGSCRECRSGNHQVCDRQTQPGFTHWGSFAQFVAIDHADTNIVRLPEGIDDLTAASLGCRFVTAFRAVVDQAKLRAGQYVAIHGCGGVGLSAVMIAQALGAEVIALDIREDALEMAREFGAFATINVSKSHEPVEEVRELSSGGVNVSLDALGSQQSCFNSIANLRKRGKHIQLGLMTGDHRHPSIPMDQVLAMELEIIGSHGMQAYRYPEMLAMIASGKLQPQKLIGKRLNLEQACEALPLMNNFSHAGVSVINEF